MIESYCRASQDEIECCPDNNEELSERTRLDRRRTLTLISIFGVFLICGTMLALTVVHDVQSRAEKEWTEFSCAESDIECLKILCPIFA